MRYRVKESGEPDESTVSTAHVLLSGVLAVGLSAYAYFYIEHFGPPNAGVRIGVAALVSILWFGWSVVRLFRKRRLVK